MSELAALVGRNVKKLREDRGLTQDELQRVLGDEWTRASVGMLESKGVRGDRIYWFASLCRALGASASDLLEPDETVNDAKTRDFHSWGPQALESAGTSPGFEKVHDYLVRVGEDNQEESRRIARQFDLTEEQLRKILAEIVGHSSPTVYRDFIAAIDTKTTKSEARSRRGHATRELRKLIESYQANGVSPVDERTKTDFKSWLSAMNAGPHGDH